MRSPFANQNYSIVHKFIPTLLEWLSGEAVTFKQELAHSLQFNKQHRDFQLYDGFLFNGKISNILSSSQLCTQASVGRPDILLGAYVYFVNNSVSIAVVTT